MLHPRDGAMFTREIHAVRSALKRSGGRETGKNRRDRAASLRLLRCAGLRGAVGTRKNPSMLGTGALPREHGTSLEAQ